MRAFRAAFIGLVALVCAGAAPAVTATSRPNYYGMTAADFFKLPEAKERIGKERLDVGLLEAAVLHASNLERAALKLKVFKQSAALNLAARRHSEEMVRLQYFDHVSPTAANRTMAERLAQVGLRNVAAAENIAVQPVKEMGSGRYTIRTNADGTETWTDSVTGKRIDYYTYEDLAKEVVTLWMKSPGHRENLVDGQYEYLGVGASRGPYGPKGQDSIYFTQNFSSGISERSESEAKRALEGGAREGR